MRGILLLVDLNVVLLLYAALTSRIAVGHVVECIFGILVLNRNLFGLVESRLLDHARTLIETTRHS